jgi:hypothetical protein
MATEEGKIEAEAPRRTSVDPLLELVVNMLDRTGPTRFTATVSIAGSVLSGHLIGEPEYLRLYAEQWPLLFRNDPETADVMRIPYLERSKKLAEDLQAAGLNDPDMAPRFAHFRDARWVTGGQLMPSAGGFLVRVRLDRIDAFSFGAFGVE